MRPGALIQPEATSIGECNEASWNATWISLLNPLRPPSKGALAAFGETVKYVPRNGDIPGYQDLDTRSHFCERTDSRSLRIDSVLS